MSCLLLSRRTFPRKKKGLVDKASANYLRSHGDQALVSFFDHLRQMANREPSDHTARHEPLDALWSEFETMRVQHSQDVAEREWRRLWGPCRYPTLTLPIVPSRDGYGLGSLVAAEHHLVLRTATKVCRFSETLCATALSGQYSS